MSGKLICSVCKKEIDPLKDGYRTSYYPATEERKVYCIKCLSKRNK